MLLLSYANSYLSGCPTYQSCSTLHDASRTPTHLLTTDEQFKVRYTVAIQQPAEMCVNLDMLLILL